MPPNIQSKSSNLSVCYQKHNIKLYRTTVVPVVLNRGETWSFTFMKEHRLTVFDNKVLTKISGPKRDEVTGDWRNCTMRSFKICTPHQVLFGCSSQEG
jgi:hypothetical protein